MRLWHYKLIPLLPDKQLVGQWRECCAIIRGYEQSGTISHPLVKKIMDYPLNEFWAYAVAIYEELGKRGYKAIWKAFGDHYKGTGGDMKFPASLLGSCFQNWHTDRYLKQCLYNLQEKADCGIITAKEWTRIMTLVDKEGIQL